MLLPPPTPELEVEVAWGAGKPLVKKSVKLAVVGGNWVAVGLARSRVSDDDVDGAGAGEDSGVGDVDDDDVEALIIDG